MKSMRERLMESRKELLDLSARNRLIHTPLDRTRAKAVRVLDEISDRAYTALISNGKSLGFRAANNDDAEQWQSEQPTLQSSANGSPAARHVDAWLQTGMDSDALQKRLLGIFYDARTFEEEQGVGILYLSLGFLKWYEADSSEVPRYSPLILLPVELQRSGVGQRFQIRALDEDLSVNLSLQEKLQAEFRIQLPDLPDKEELTPSAYVAQVVTAVRAMSRWEVLPNEMFLGFYSFAKFLMYRDLAPEVWPEGAGPDAHPIVSALLGDGFAAQGEPLCGEGDSVDEHLPPAAMIHVLDSDSSQAIAVEEVRRGRNLVVQGPPGTGKSQTITNMIAACVRDGKKVLFVAEKMAALEVVSRRLSKVGLGDICLELHSGKASKREVIAELGRTLSLGSPRISRDSGLIEDLTRTRDRLNEYLKSLHAPITRAGVSPYESMGSMIGLMSGGQVIPDFELPGATQWTREQFQEFSGLIENVALQLGRLGKPSECVWRGAAVRTVLPPDLPRLDAQLQGLVANVDATLEALALFSRSLHCRKATSISGNAQAMKVAQYLLAAPAMDRKCFSDPVWTERRDDISRLIEHGRGLARARSTVGPKVVEAAWARELQLTRRTLAVRGRSLLRWFFRDWREAQATLREIMRESPPRLAAEQLLIIDTLIGGQRDIQALRGPADTLGRDAFGKFWRGVDTDWAALEAIDSWERSCQAAQLPDAFRRVVAAADRPEEVERTLANLKRSLEKLSDSFNGVLTSLQLDLKMAFGVEDILSVPLEDLRRRFVSCQASLETLPVWAAYWGSWSRLKSQGLGSLADKLYDGSVPPTLALAAFKVRYHEESLRRADRERPAFAEFDGAAHQQLVERFRRLDLDRIELARNEVAGAHHARLPAQAGSGEVAVIRREVEKKRAHKPLRKLLSEAGNAIQAIKPVFMMSPTSVAQFLRPGGIQFDVILIDEASQVRPVDALGAIGRSKQIVVVGDAKQLPPTRFFDKVLGDDEGDDKEEEFAVGDIESILGLCNAQGVPSRMLRWHYRSEHHSLIAVSNREFYDNRLYIVPSPMEKADIEGLHLCHCPDGVFDRGHSATNRVEAHRVASAAIEHARRHPNDSLGIAAFSVAQRDAILDELESLRKENSDCESFFASGADEPFFVKALEHVQGDERDTIFISVGYGRDSNGKLTMNFGPLQTDGGERRLNVLITRAKRRCLVFSSITADDIDLSRAKSRGVAALKTYLQYARDGKLETAVTTDRGHDSEFEAQVHRALAAHGYDVVPQVGIAGFFIDLAIRDSEQQGRFLLGIECDGRRYHESRSARDRDRLRQAILEKCGWKIHRIWSTDWFRMQAAQLKRTIQAIEDAKSERQQATSEADRARMHEPEVSIERHATNAPLVSKPVATVPYRQASFPISDGRSIVDLTLMELAPYAVKVVQVEGPVHQHEVARRLVELWGGQRTTRRIVTKVDAAIAWAVDRGRIVKDGDFVHPAEQTIPPIRDRSAVHDATLRRPHNLPPSEIREALMHLVRASFSVATDELLSETARLLGIAATSSQLREVLRRELDSLVACGILVLRQDRWHCIMDEDRHLSQRV